MPQEKLQPFALLSYAESGKGKTTDLCYAFPRGLFIGPPGAFLPAETVCGYRPKQITRLRTLEEVVATAEQVAAKIEHTGQREYDGLIIDDLTLFSDAQLQTFEERGLDKFKFWSAVRKLLLRMRDVMRHVGMHVAVNAHERGPHVDERKGYVIGGPNLPGTMPADMPKAFDAVLRVVPVEDEGTAAAFGWPYVFEADERDTQYVTKNKLHIYGRFPMNTGELLRLRYGATPEASPFPVQRHPDLTWQEAVVEKISKHFDGVDPASTDHREVRRSAVAALSAKGYSKQAIAWTLRDAAARSILRRLHSEAALRRFAVG